MLDEVLGGDDHHNNEGHSVFCFIYFLSSWHRAIFPQSPPCSIVTAVEFHHQVRDGSVWFLHA